MNVRKEPKQREVLDCIDRPIRPLILQLCRVGLMTKWSCCGFPYKGEEVPKTHANQPFVVFHPIAGNTTSLSAFFSLAKAVAQSYWRFRPYNDRGEWHLMGSSSESEFYRRDKPIGLHDYETALINIQRLTKIIKVWPAIEDKTFTITDGNTGYNESTDGEWQTKPAQKSTIAVKSLINEPKKTTEDNSG